MDRDHIDFDDAAEEIEDRLEMSPGAAQAKLREFCRSGVVRSWQMGLMGSDKEIMPSDWKEIDWDIFYRNRVAVSKMDLDYQITSHEDASRDTEIVKLLSKGLKPGKGIQWKKFCETVRKQCNARPTDRGFSDETIENVTRELQKKLFGQ